MLLQQRLTSYRILLASHSPRRQQLLRDCGIDYQLVVGDAVDESYPAHMDACDVPIYLSQLKGAAYTEPLGEHDVLLTADTVVVADGAILGKPHDRNEACAMLHRLSGCEHQVVTGVTLRSATRRRSFATTTSVWFRALRDEEITYYVDTYRPYDKAGAYGIQEWIGYVAIERIDGSFYNVMGLPIQQLYMELDGFLPK
jgi:septum formation protein